MKLRLSLVVAVAAVALTGCAASSAEPGLECLAPDPAVGAAIAAGATTAAITPGALAAVKAPAMQDAYLVAMRFTSEGLDGEDAGVWAVGDISGGATSVLSVDGVAHTFTNWPNEVGGEQLDVTEPGAEDALACLDAG